MSSSPLLFTFILSITSPRRIHVSFKHRRNRHTWRGYFRQGRCATSIGSYRSNIHNAYNLITFQQHTFLHYKHLALSHQSLEPFTRDQKRLHVNLQPKQQPSSTLPLMSTMTKTHLSILIHFSQDLTFHPLSSFSQSLNSHPSS